MTHRPTPTIRAARRLLAAAVGLGLAASGLAATSATAAPSTTAAPPAATAPSTTAAAVEPPAPEVLDIGFADGSPTDAAQQLPAKTWGAPTYTVDETLREDPTDILTVDGVDDAVSFEADPWSGLSDGFTIECVFRIDTPMPVSGEKDLCSNKEGGGFSVYVNGGDLGTMAHIGGGYKKVLTPVKEGRWYHALSVWDGTTLTLYLNGVKAGSTAATGTLQPPTAASRRFVVGADSAPSGIGQIAPPASFAAAGLFGRAVSSDEADALAGQWQTAPATPDADVLDVDFADGTAADRAQNLTMTTTGSPQIGEDTALRADVGTFDGVDDSFAYDFSTQWDKIDTSVSIECTFRFNGTLPAASEKDLCSSKEGGGYSVVIYGDKLTFTAHVDGAYHGVNTQIVPGRWYHAVGTWDGTTERLYVDGALAAEAPLTGDLRLPSSPSRNFFFVGADSRNQFYAPATIRNARVYSESLTADEIDALNVAALGAVRDADVELTGTVPARDAHLTSPIEFSADIRNQGNATGWSYLLDGEPINLGQQIGAGLASGEHTIAITATDVFGKALSWEVTFTSATIPSGGGVDTGQGNGEVTLSAIATDPEGGDVTTTFKQATATAADGGFSGVVPVLPSSLEFTYTDGGTITGRQLPDGQTTGSPSSGQIPFQRFDIEVPADGGDRQVSWSGVVDPERAVTLRAWDPAAGEWSELATVRGTADGDTTLAGVLRQDQLDGTIAHLLVTGDDPFADDLAPRDATAAEPANRDHFENPDDYDFSLAHFTDTQYISEGAVGGTYDDWDGIAEDSDVQLAEEQAVWARAYQATTDWITANAESKKIAYTAHTGDVIENNTADPAALPGKAEQVDKEFAFASGAQKTLEDAGLINQVIAGNHDNQSGNETGSESRFSEIFSADRYYDAAQNWGAEHNASYHVWDETTAADGSTEVRGSDNQNNYVLFSAGGLDFVAVGLSYGVTQEEAAWATTIFQRYSDRNGILITHAYLDPSTNHDGRGAGFSTDGSRLFDQVVEANPNVFLVLAGHEHGVGTNLKTEVGVTVSHNVVELLADYQFYTVSAAELFADKADADGNVDLNGDGVIDHKGTDQLQFGASFMRLLQFDVDRSEMSVDTYSPMLDNFGATEYDGRNRYDGSEDNMVLPVDLTSRTTSFTTDSVTVLTPTDTVIGEATARSGWPASVVWTGLTEGELYGWTSTSRTGEGDLVGSIDQIGGTFVATAAGTDTEPPVITVPATTELTVGDTFDPLEGVTAVDNTDGDVTDGLSVIGEVDTATAGSYALTYQVSDTNGNQAVAPRAVTVKESTAPELEPSTVTAEDVAATIGKDVTLTATVSPRDATGTVTFQTDEDTWCEATVSKGTASCVVRALPQAGETYGVTAFYSGDSVYAPSDATFVMSVGEGSFVKAPRPKVSGRATVGATLTAATGTWKPAASFSYQWFAGTTAIDGATGATYQVTAADIGRRLSVTVTGHAAGYADKTVTSSQSPPVRK